jgi:Leucine-rich repeat (LRR) protein
MNCNGCGRKQLWFNLRYYPSICLEGLRKTTETLARTANIQAGIQTCILPNTFSYGQTIYVCFFYCKCDLQFIYSFTMTVNDPFTGLNSLRRLQMQNNLIQHLPEEVLSDLEALEQLSLRKNHLSFIPPQLFSNLKHLKHLDLTNNWISSVHVLIFKINRSRLAKPI